MSERGRMFLLILIMITICFIVVGITMSILYRTAFNEERERLVETAQSQARLIEAVARFDTIYSNDYPDGPVAATISQIIDAHRHYKGFGETGEFTLARREGENIVFLLTHRHFDLDNPRPIRFDSNLAESMKLALSGRSGTVVGLDYRGETVLAAHEPVKELNLGIVAKIDLAEIRGPFVTAGLIALGFAVLVVLAGAALFLRISNPIIRRLEEQAAQLTMANERMMNEIEERKRAEEELRKAHDELEQRVEVRTAELTASNEQLTKEINDRKQTEEALQESETQYRAIFEQAADSIVLVDAETGILTEFNDMTCKNLGFTRKEFERLKIREFEIIESEEEIKEHIERILNEGSDSFETKHRKKNGEIRDILVSSRAISIRGRDFIQSIWHDISDLKRAEEALRESREQLFQAQKMESLGRLVAGVAHEINNPNNFITFNIPIMRDYLQELIPIIDDYARTHPDYELFGMPYSDFREDIFKLLDNIEHGSRRINATVSGLKEFARKKDKVEMRWVDIRKVVEDGIAITRGKIKRMVKSFEITIPDELPKVYTDPDILEHVLINLLINATQAADNEDSWIKLNVELGNTEQEHLIIDVSDNGCGMDKETMVKIFDPFFTTKSPGEGTGLGLSVCHTLVEEIGGRIDVKSEPGQGSTFRVILPAIEEGENTWITTS